MRKMIQRGIVVLCSMIMGGLPVLTEAVYAFERQDDKWRRPRTKTEENMTVCEDEDNTGTTGTVKNEIPEEGILPVKITRDDGIEIIPRDKEVININDGRRLRICTGRNSRLGNRNDNINYSSRKFL